MFAFNNLIPLYYYFNQKSHIVLNTYEGFQRTNFSSHWNKKSTTLKGCHLKLPHWLVLYSSFKKFKQLPDAKTNETKPNTAIIESTDRGKETANRMKFKNQNPFQHCSQPTRTLLGHLNKWWIFSWLITGLKHRIRCVYKLCEVSKRGWRDEDVCT